MADLRERRRRETERSIQRAALRLAGEQGVETVTVEAICAEAGVSVRTFFNYFPFKEAVYAITPPPFDEAAVSAFVEGRTTLVEGLTDLFASQLAHLGEDRRVLRALREVALNHPRVVAMQISKLHEVDAELAGLIARRLGRRKADRDCRVLAAAATAAARAVLDSWAEAAKGDVIEALRAGMSSLRLLADDSVAVPAVADPAAA